MHRAASGIVIGHKVELTASGNNSLLDVEVVPEINLFPRQTVVDYHIRVDDFTGQDIDKGFVAPDGHVILAQIFLTVLNGLGYRVPRLERILASAGDNHHIGGLRIDAGVYEMRSLLSCSIHTIDYFNQIYDFYAF